MRQGLFFLLSAGLVSVLGAEVKLNGTTVTGIDIPTNSSSVEFFGGTCSLLRVLKRGTK
jgi:hypothetical protein